MTEENSKLEPFSKRVLASLSVGFIIYYFSEILFWARYDPTNIIVFLITTPIGFGVFILSIIQIYRSNKTNKIL